jgi:hypothetical protein
MMASHYWYKNERPLLPDSLKYVHRGAVDLEMIGNKKERKKHLCIFLKSNNYQMHIIFFTEIYKDIKHM